MTKVFICKPDLISDVVVNFAIDAVTDYFGPEITVSVRHQSDAYRSIQGVIDFDGQTVNLTGEKLNDLGALGATLAQMSTCDAVVFCGDWEDDCICANAFEILKNDSKGLWDYNTRTGLTKIKIW